MGAMNDISRYKKVDVKKLTTCRESIQLNFLLVYPYLPSPDLIKTRFPLKKLLELKKFLALVFQFVTSFSMAFLVDL